jgi:hypothetical protein
MIPARRRALFMSLACAGRAANDPTMSNRHEVHHKDRVRGREWRLHLRVVGACAGPPEETVHGCRTRREAALRAAVSHRDTLPVKERQKFHVKPSRRNSSGRVGVGLHIIHGRHEGYVAYIGSGQHHTLKARIFTFAKFGPRAMEKAIRQRRQWERDAG